MQHVQLGVLLSTCNRVIIACHLENTPRGASPSAGRKTWALEASLPLKQSLPIELLLAAISSKPICILSASNLHHILLNQFRAVRKKKHTGDNYILLNPCPSAFSFFYFPPLSLSSSSCSKFPFHFPLLCIISFWNDLYWGKLESEGRV